MSKTVSYLNTKLITYETTLSFAEVTARFEEQVNKEGSAGIVPRIQGATTRQDIVDIVDGITQGRDFLFFSEIDHQRWLNTYRGVDDTPGINVYTIGNPTLAEKIFQYDVRAACVVPFRILISGKPNGEGTSIAYHAPGSLIDPSDNTELKQLLVALDGKVEHLIRQVLSV